jgi:acyl-CoA thioesterase
MHPLLADLLDRPTASGSRGLARGVSSQDGRLIASTAHEGLVRRRGGALTGL